MSATLDKDTIERMEYFRRAARHLVSYARDQVGLNIERTGCGLDHDGSFDPDKVNAGEREEWKNVLFSCHVIETITGDDAPAVEYTRLIPVAERRLLPTLYANEPKGSS